ncbi:hypothetical protein [Fusobacterium sp.]|uniref:toxin-antitoxin system YwqK family antitoxin n=1 Tax=Fusobacterium sp. TaxID=68766 RepID=UPI0025C638A1|nr:hypothetical protein [Fusobacterium sp.]
MKKLAIASLIILALTGCTKEIDYSQKQVRNGIVYTVNADTPFTGKVVDKYSNGQKKLVEKFKDGKFDGEQVYYYENGQIEDKIDYKLGEPIGKYYSYHRNGEIAYTGEFLNGKKNGNWDRYTEDKKLILTEVYENGELKDVKQYLVDTEKLKNKINNLFN